MRCTGPVLRVPEALFLELDHPVMDRPFFIMHRAAGRTSNGAVPASEELREKIAHQFLDELVRIQSLDYHALGWSFLVNPESWPNRRPARCRLRPACGKSGGSRPHNSGTRRLSIG